MNTKITSLPNGFRYFVKSSYKSPFPVVWTNIPWGDGHTFFSTRSPYSGVWYGWRDGVLIDDLHFEVTYNDALKVLGVAPTLPIKEEFDIKTDAVTVKVNKWLSGGLQRYWFSRGFNWPEYPNVEVTHEDSEYLNLNMGGDYVITFYHVSHSQAINLDITKDWDKIVKITDRIVALRDTVTYSSIWEFVYHSVKSDTTKWRRVGVTSNTRYYIKGIDLNDNNIEKTFTKSKIVGGMDKVTITSVPKTTKSMDDLF